MTLVYFLVENIVSGILGVVGSATGNKIWSDIPHYFLGTNLSNLADTASATGAPFDATHAVVVTLMYSALFLGVAVYLTRTRDVLE